MNSKLTALAAAIMVAAATGAQTPKRDFKRDIRLSASNLLAYPGPDNSRKMTPAPDSLKPFYISHYGRHGSRFLMTRKTTPSRWQRYTGPTAWAN